MLSKLPPLKYVSPCPPCQGVPEAPPPLSAAAQEDRLRRVQEGRDEDSFDAAELARPDEDRYREDSGVEDSYDDPSADRESPTKTIG